MKNEFAIKCNTWEEACELSEIAERNDFKLQGYCHNYSKPHFNMYNGIINFRINENGAKRFWIGVTRSNPFPYSKQKAIELLSWKEPEKLKIEMIEVSRPLAFNPVTIYEFTFSDGERIKTDKSGKALDIYSIPVIKEYFPLINEFIKLHEVFPKKKETCQCNIQGAKLNGLDVFGWQEEYEKLHRKYRKAKKDKKEYEALASCWKARSNIFIWYLERIDPDLNIEGKDYANIIEILSNHVSKSKQ